MVISLNSSSSLSSQAYSDKLNRISEQDSVASKTFDNTIVAIEPSQVLLGSNSVQLGLYKTQAWRDQELQIQTIDRNGNSS